MAEIKRESEITGPGLANGAVTVSPSTVMPGTLSLRDLDPILLSLRSSARKFETTIWLSCISLVLKALMHLMKAEEDTTIAPSRIPKRARLIGVACRSGPARYIKTERDNEQVGRTIDSDAAGTHPGYAIISVRRTDDAHRLLVQRADNNTEARMICCALESIPTRTFASPFASTAPSSPPSSPSSPSPNFTGVDTRATCLSPFRQRLRRRLDFVLGRRLEAFHHAHRFAVSVRARGCPGSSSCRVHVRFIPVWEVFLVLALRPRLAQSPLPSTIMRRITRSTPRIPCPSVAATRPAATRIWRAALPSWGRAQVPTAASEGAAVGAVRKLKTFLAFALCSVPKPSPAAVRASITPFCALLRPPSPPASHSPLEYAFGVSADPPRRPRPLGQDCSYVRPCTMAYTQKCGFDGQARAADTPELIQSLLELLPLEPRLPDHHVLHDLIRIVLTFSDPAAPFVSYPRRTTASTRRT
ncbi:hypothetical protein C8R45DRAFT_1216503 [Mycena sanguinolenta]|nr:hypothetical protein C8R45DRAFT_1216503 [Mycena sanguinolenta]